MVQVSIQHRLGSFSLSVDLTWPAAGGLCLLGPNGSGKTSVLRAIAGLLRPEQGRVAVNGTIYFDSQRGISLPPEARNAGMVFQDLALFPHLTVEENIAFGLRARRVDGASRRERVSEALERFGLTALAAQRPGVLSRGEQQLVAIARAMVLRPSLLLLDEPLASVDVQTRPRLRRLIRQHLRDMSLPTVWVSHDPADALSFGEHLAIMEDGRVVEAGPRNDILARPTSDFLSSLLGVNIFEGEVVESHPAAGLATIRVGSGSLRGPLADPGPVVVRIPASQVGLSLGPLENTSVRNVIGGAIQALTSVGTTVRVTVGDDFRLAALISPEACAKMELAEGRFVYAFFKAMAVEYLE